LVALFPDLGKGGFLVRMRGSLLLAVFPLSFLRMPLAFAAVSSPANAAFKATSISSALY
jgi:hypothetical protein